jgi:dihydroxy-acid dehydratase
MPGSVMAMGRLNRPAIMVYGGSIHSGKWKGESLNIVSAFEALGKIQQYHFTRRFQRCYSKFMSGAGACGGMHRRIRCLSYWL